MPGKLILINGIPGTGKTTLAQKLAKDTGLPLVMKDELKEFFFDSLQSNSLQESQMIGRVVFETLYILIDQCLELGKDVMVECPWYASFARPKIQASVDEHGGSVLEIYVTVREDVRLQRVRQRATDGSRHQQHAAGDTSINKSEAALRETYAPLNLGETITVDTTRFGEAEYASLLANITDKLTEND